MKGSILLLMIMCSGATTLGFDPWPVERFATNRHDRPVFGAVNPGSFPRSPSAEIQPGRWEKLDSLPNGRIIIVNLKTGGRIKGSFQGSGHDYLIVLSPSGRESRLAKSSVRRIVSRWDHHAGKERGEQIGGLIGFGAAVVVAVAAVSERKRRRSRRCWRRGVCRRESRNLVWIPGG